MSGKVGVGGQAGLEWDPHTVLLTLDVCPTLRLQVCGRWAHAELGQGCWGAQGGGAEVLEGTGAGAGSEEGPKKLLVCLRLDCSF